jgi:hypothetical protein
MTSTDSTTSPFDQMLAKAKAKGAGDSASDGAHAKPRRFVPIFLDDITVDDEPAYIVEGIIPAGPSLGLIAGLPKSLKSFFLKDVFMHIAAGKKYAGRAVQQGVTVYVTSEGVPGIKRRAVAMRRHYEVEGKSIPFLLVPAMPNLGTGDGDCRELIAGIRSALAEAKLPPDTAVKAIAVDTLRRATPGKSENDTKDMSSFIATCEAIEIEFQCFVGVVHHSPRSDNTRGAGTTAIEGASDVIMSAVRADGPASATITVERMKDGEEGMSWTIEVRSMEVGKDRNKKPKFGGYVVLVDEPAVKGAATKSKGAQWPKSLRLLYRIMTGLLLDAGVERRPFPDGPIVRMVKKEVVRAEFYKQYAADAEDEKQRQVARRQAFNRAIKDAQAVELIVIREIETAQYMWFGRNEGSRGER